MAFGPWLAAWSRATLWALLVGGLLGGGAVAGVLYRGAQVRVEARMSGAVWSVPGHVWSGPIEVWRGLALDAETFARQLTAAGYARVPTAVKPGDFQVAADAVMVRTREESGPGWSVKKGEVLVTFRDGFVGSISPSARATLAPMSLATVRGADNENRNPVPLAQIPLAMQHAVIAMEDARFYVHRGVDPLGIARALWVDLLHQSWEQGGSTLTQQLAKNVFTGNDRSADRKLREALIALALEERHSKGEILHLYLNEIYLGQAGGSSICGVDAAARAFFGLPIERIDAAQAATIAGIIASPNQWSPIRHPEEALARRNVVLDRMVEQEYLTAAERDALAAQPLGARPTGGGRDAPWAVDVAMEAVEADLGPGTVAARGLDVYTTISPPLQALAERAVAEGVAEVTAAHPKLTGVQAALVVVRARDGAVVAMVGGRDYDTSPYNRATQAVRQVGSTVKGLTMLIGFETDPTLAPATRFDDAAITRSHDGKAWTPANYDRRFLGPISLRHAIASSRNVPAVLLSERIGLGTLQTRLRALGLSGATDYPSVALGGFGATPMQLAGAYAVFAGDGHWHAPIVTREAAAPTEGGGTRSVWEAAPATAPEVRYTAASRWLATDVLRTVMHEGTGKSAVRYGVGPGAAGKSGTTDGYVDAWFAGIVGPYAVVAWMGNDRNEPIGLTGSAAALPIWARFVAGTGLSDDIPDPPPGLVPVDVCDATDLPPCADCTETRREWFRSGRVPEADCGPLDKVGEAVEGAWKKLGRMLGLGKDPEAAPDPALDPPPAAPPGR